jgi:hypothetical protein
MGLGSSNRLGHRIATGHAKHRFNFIVTQSGVIPAQSDHERNNSTRHYDKLDIRNLMPSSALGSNDSGTPIRVELDCAPPIPSFADQTSPRIETNSCGAIQVLR